MAPLRNSDEQSLELVPHGLVRSLGQWIWSADGFSAHVGTGSCNLCPSRRRGVCRTLLRGRVARQSQRHSLD